MDRRQSGGVGKVAAGGAPSRERFVWRCGTNGDTESIGGVLDRTSANARPSRGRILRGGLSLGGVGRGGGAAGALPGPRSFATSIYFLLRAGEFSALHRIASDELWHFYDGDPLEVETIHPDGRHETLHLGRNADRGELFQAVVPAGCWFGAVGALPSRVGYSLVGCTVAPGFDFQDFELGRRAELIRAFPGHRTLIERLTRE